MHREAFEKTSGGFLKNLGAFYFLHKYENANKCTIFYC